MPDDFALDARRKLNDTLTAIERETGIPFIRPDSDTWILDLPSTRVHIRRSGPWVTMASELLNDARGPNEGRFARELLERNAQLNGVKIGLEQGRITLNTEQPAADVTVGSLVTDLILHHKRYEGEQPDIQKRARELGLE